ncbi:MAG: methyltransferase domain-containing protein [Leptospiraceae bacterium]|nr:methyltransferase domain-containing protein [Leptospiraceae bacterium]
MSFEKDYWSEIYADRLIDGTFNAAKHADYIKSIFALSEFPVRSIIDIGFGKAKLLEQIGKKINPDRIIALDVSNLMVETLKKKKWIEKYNIAISHSKFEEFNTDYLVKYPLDLAISNSVFQYLDDVESNIKKLASIARFSYFSVPTKNDYLRMENELGFKDKYANVRTKEFYIKLIDKYFTRVSYNLLESKIVREYNYFPAELYRG